MFDLEKLKPIIEILSEDEGAPVDAWLGSWNTTVSIVGDKVDFYARYLDSGTLRRFELARIAVNHKRTGVATRAIEEFIKYAREEQMEEVILEAVRSAAAQELCKKLNFELIEPVIDVGLYNYRIKL
jgi:hypothetical protein